MNNELQQAAHLLVDIAHEHRYDRERIDAISDIDLVRDIKELQLSWRVEDVIRAVTALHTLQTQLRDECREAQIDLRQERTIINLLEKALNP